MAGKQYCCHHAEEEASTHSKDSREDFRANTKRPGWIGILSQIPGLLSQKFGTIFIHNELAAREMVVEC